MITNLNLSEGAKRKIKETEAKVLEITVFNGKIDIERIKDKDDRILYLYSGNGRVAYHSNENDDYIIEYLRSETNPDYVVEIENGKEISRYNSCEKDGKKIITEEWISEEEETNGMKMKSITTVDITTNLIEDYEVYDKLSGVLLLKSRSEYDDKKNIVKKEDKDFVKDVHDILTFEYEERENNEQCIKTCKNEKFISESITDRLGNILYRKEKYDEVINITENNYEYYTDKNGEEKSINLTRKSTYFNEKGDITYVAYEITNEYDKNYNLIKTISIGHDKNFNTTALCEYDKNNRAISRVKYNEKNIIQQSIITYNENKMKEICYYKDSEVVEYVYLNDKLIKLIYNNKNSTTTTLYEEDGKIKSRIEIDKDGKEINREEYEYITIEL